MSKLSILGCLSATLILNFYGVCGEPTVSISPHDANLQLHKNATFTVALSQPPNETITMELTTDGNNMVWLSQYEVAFDENVTQCLVTMLATSCGQLVISINGDNSSYYDATNAYVRVSIVNQMWLETFNMVIGWIYFVAWSVSFYPQIWINFKRRSVIGLNLDFTTLNILGFFSYSVYNCGLFFIPSIQSEYFSEHQHGVMPVQIQDVFFALQALFAALLTGFEAIIFERGTQKVSLTCRGILGLLILFLLVSLVFSCTAVISWLQYLYFFSYVKLIITVIKYIPQAYFNFRRKSTSGWSIGNILLDFTGGFFSMLQMFVIAYNYDDWSSLFGDPTKFGLGLFSMLFDTLFMVQHYILYRKRPSHYESIEPSGVTDGGQTPTVSDADLTKESC